MTFQKENELRELLLPYIHTFPERKYDVEKEELEEMRDGPLSRGPGNEIVAILLDIRRSDQGGGAA